MRFTWLIFVALGVVLTTTCVDWLLARQIGVCSGRKGWVTNTSYLRDLPRYWVLVRRARVSLAMALICFLIAIIATSVSADAPVDHYVKHDKSASRGIVLCLSTSGSMLPYDSKIGRASQEIISHFEGGRISLQLWGAYSMTIFPLIDDYEMATDVLQDMSDTIDTGLTRIDGRLNATQELFDYPTPVMGKNREVSSIVGSDLASCAMDFDHSNKQRSHTVLLVIDNEVHGDGVYNLSEAIEFARSQGVTVTTLYPGSDIILSSEALQLHDEVHKTGGGFYDASSSSSVGHVVRQIEAEQKEELNSVGKMLKTNRLGAALEWTFFGVMPLLGLLAFGGL